MSDQEKAGDASPPRASRHLDAPVQSARADGWRFTWNMNTRFIQAEHPRGGRASVAEIAVTHLFDYDALGLAITRALNAEPCMWNEEPGGEFWNPGCGADAWTFTTGGPQENMMVFCPFCARRIEALNTSFSGRRPASGSPSTGSAG